MATDDEKLELAPDRAIEVARRVGFSAWPRRRRQPAQPPGRHRRCGH